MAKIAVYLAALVAIVVITESSGYYYYRRCPFNTEWSTCPKQASCRPTCSRPDGAEACATVCDRPTCVCRRGFLLNSNGRCVSPSMCPNGRPQCPANKVYSTCPKQRQCRPSCSNPNGAEVCPAICDAPGCVCQDGFVLNAKGDCVLKSKC